MPQNALIGLIYEAANDPLLWDALLTKFAEAVHAETAGLLTQDKAGRWARNLATVGMDSATRKCYDEYFVTRNPWLPRRKLIAESVETEQELLSNRELVKTEFYRDFLKPNIWLHACSTVTNVEESKFSSIYTLRSARNGAFTADEVRFCFVSRAAPTDRRSISQRIVGLKYFRTASS